MQYIAIMDAFIDGGLGEVHMGGQRSSNLKKYENKADIFPTSKLKGKYIVPIVKYYSGFKGHFQISLEILFH